MDVIINHTNKQVTETPIGYLAAYQVFETRGKKYMKIGNAFTPGGHNAIELVENLGPGFYGEKIDFPSGTLVAAFKTTITTERI